MNNWTSVASFMVCQKGRLTLAALLHNACLVELVVAASLLGSLGLIWLYKFLEVLVFRRLFC
jgi:hypothetical protein